MSTVNRFVLYGASAEAFSRTVPVIELPTGTGGANVTGLFVTGWPFASYRLNLIDTVSPILYILVPSSFSGCETPKYWPLVFTCAVCISGVTSGSLVVIVLG